MSFLNLQCRHRPTTSSASATTTPPPCLLILVVAQTRPKPAKRPNVLEPHRRVGDRVVERHRERVVLLWSHLERHCVRRLLEHWACRRLGRDLEAQAHVTESLVRLLHCSIQRDGPCSCCQTDRHCRRCIRRAHIDRRILIEHTRRIIRERDALQLPIIIIIIIAAIIQSSTPTSYRFVSLLRSISVSLTHIPNPTSH